MDDPCRLAHQPHFNGFQLGPARRQALRRLAQRHRVKEVAEDAPRPRLAGHGLQRRVGFEYDGRKGIAAIQEGGAKRRASSESVETVRGRGKTPVGNPLDQSV